MVKAKSKNRRQNKSLKKGRRSSIRRKISKSSKKKIRCFSRKDSKNKLYVTCVKKRGRRKNVQLRRRKGGGVLPASYFGGKIHPSYQKKTIKCMIY